MQPRSEPAVTPTRRRHIEQDAQRRARDIQHQTRLKQIRDNGQRELAKMRARQAADRRSEEKFVRDSLDRRLTWARAEAKRGKLVPLDLAQRWHRIRLEQAGIILPQHVAAVPRWRAHIVELCQRHQVKLTWEPAAAGVNAYAWPTFREIEIPPIVSPESYGEGLHEFGHCMHPCKNHRRVRAELGATVCVRCEIVAWTWAQSHAQPAWTREMHQRMAHCLQTYARYATESEHAAIRSFVSPFRFYQWRQQQVNHSLEIR